MSDKASRYLLITDFSGIPESADAYDEVDVRIAVDGDPFQADATVYSAIMPFLDTYVPGNHGGRRIYCKLLIRSASTYSLLQSRNDMPSLDEKAEIFPYTVEDMWAHSLFATFRDGSGPALDWRTISYESDVTVHLVIIGWSVWAESLARMAALVCHFPNYVRDHSLRTRITVVDNDAMRRTAAFRGRMGCLLDNSYVRTVDTKACRSDISRPAYADSREDFVDVEWEFVEGDETSDALYNKLSMWSSDAGQCLTLAVCSDSEERNMAVLGLLPPAVSRNEVPVWVKIENDLLFSAANRRANVRSFGRPRPYDALDSTRRMAMAINYVYDKCYSLNAGNTDAEVMVPAEIDMPEAERLWQQLSPAKRFSNIYNALSLATKMRSLGHAEDDWETCYSVSSKEIDIISIVEHDRWCVEELILGFRPVDDEEQKAVESDISLKKDLRSRKIHYDLRAYDDLRPDETGRNVALYDICLTQAIPLVAMTCRTVREGGS